jgi:cytochrome c oxidase assembly protein Cox11
MPVLFYLDPEIDTDINTREVPEITLSYTFFAVEN